jgi:hypothetical protein
MVQGSQRIPTGSGHIAAVMDFDKQQLSYSIVLSHDRIQG